MKKLLFMVAAILVFASAPKVLMAAPAVMAEQAASEEVEDYKIDWTTQSGYNNMWYPTETMNKDNFSVSTTDGLSVKNEKAIDNWKIQYFVGNNVSLNKGTDYVIKITMKGNTAGSATVAVGNWSSQRTPQTVNFTNEYNTYILPYTCDYEGNGFILMQSGDFVGTINVKSIEVVHSGKAIPSFSLDLANVDYSVSSTPAPEHWGNVDIYATFDDKEKACQIGHGTTTEAWQAQVNFANVYPKGATIKLSMTVRGDAALGSISAELQNPNGFKFNGGKYVSCGSIPVIDLPTSYKEVAVSIVCSGDGATRLLLNLGKYPGTVYIKNLKIVAEGVKQESLTIPSSSFATYAAYYPVNYGSLGLEAYAVILDAVTKTIKLVKIDGVVPAGKAVLLKGTPGKSYELTLAQGAVTQFETDLQVSEGSATSTGAATLYALSTVGDVTAFYPVIKGSKITAKRCYLEVKSTSSSNAAFYSLGTNFGETTGISSVENKVEKADAPVYNLAGQLVGKDYKGLVIKNGKKFVIK